ncbi:hypothetical protein AVEN_245079-1 [Araneus ventricosus]|uniref:Uncharacterized protein n=1 Tax=Araneus ventricosus TaxID=182803 RepID=A0A4Y2E6Q3_ARAVE|nr:hypothetical protein AVEN_245079-1 [Araneus ventricosus]
MRLAYVEGPLNVRENFAAKYIVYAVKDEDTQHTTRWMDAKDLKSALSYNMKYEAAKTVSKTSRHDCIIQLATPVFTRGSRSSGLSTTNCEEKRGEGGRVHFTNPYVNKTSVYKGSELKGIVERTPRRKIGPPITLINEAIFRPDRLSNEGKRHKPAVLSVKAKPLDRPEPPV